ncbi:MAG: O-antigen ligase family protein [Patescibacteria group bacterium]
MTSKTLLALITFLLFAAIIGTPLFYLRTNVYPQVLPKTGYFQIVVEIMFALWLYLVLLDKKYRPKLTPLTVSLFVFLGVLFLTALTGVDFSKSLWSLQGRAIGIFAFLHFGALFLVVASLKRELAWQKLWYASLATSIVVCVIGFIQLKIPTILFPTEGSIGGRPGSTFGNPTFMAGYLLFNAFIAGWLIVEEWRRGIRGDQKTRRRAGSPSFIFLITAFLVTALGLLVAQTRGTFAGVGLGFLGLMIYGSLNGWREKKIQRISVALLIILFMFGGFFFLTRGSGIWASVPLLNRLQNVSFSSPDFLPRLVALKAAWSGFIERPVFGWGWENFNIVFNKFYDPKVLTISYGETRFDKPHNVVFEYLVSGGITLLLAYLALIASAIYEVFFVRRWAKEEKDRGAAPWIVALIIAYIVHDFFVFDTLGPLLMFFLILGWLEGSYVDARQAARTTPREEKKNTYVREQGVLKHGIGYGLLCAALIMAYMVNVRALSAGYYQALGFVTTGKNPLQGIHFFEKAVSIREPYQWNIERDFATVTSEAYFYNPGKISRDVAFRGLALMEKVAAEHPLDAYNHYALVDMYNQVFNPDDETILTLPAAEKERILKEEFALLDKAEKEAAIALTLSPNRQEVYFSLSKTKTLRGDYAGALKILEKTIALNPEVPDAHFYYGLVAFASDKLQLGYVEVKKAIALGRKWKKYQEPRVVAGYFADAGYLDEAIELYKTSLSMEPGELETKIKLGVAYYYGNQRALAKQYLTEVAAAVDLSRSIGYASIKPILMDLGIPVE